MKTNRLRRLLNEELPTLGTRVHNIWPGTVEVLGHTGMFDYVEFLAEYAPFDLFTLDNFSRAVELFNMSAIIKVDSEPRVYQAQRGVGAGFDGVLFADVRSVEDAIECVRILKPDTPKDEGRFSVAMRRFSYVGYGGGSEYVQYLRDTIVMVMIEKQSAVDQIDQILETEGIDLVQFGPADYAMNIGKPGEVDHPHIRSVERKVIERSIQFGKAPRAEINHPDQAKYYLDLGVKNFSLGIDMSILFKWWEKFGGIMRRIMDE